MRNTWLVPAAALLLGGAGAFDLGCGGASNPLGGLSADAGTDGTSGGSGSGSGGSSGAGSGSTGSGSGSSSSTGSGGSSSSSGGTSSSSTGGSTGSSGGSSSSSSSSSGNSGSGGILCPTAPCTSTETCCADPTGKTVACQPNCSSKDVLTCLRPSDCPGQDCCATVNVAGQAPNCTAQWMSTKCETCTTQISFTCQGTDTLHLCEAASDCSKDIASPNCCDLNGVYACVSTTLRYQGMLTCK